MAIIGTLSNTFRRVLGANPALKQLTYACAGCGLFSKSGARLVLDYMVASNIQGCPNETRIVETTLHPNFLGTTLNPKPQTLNHVQDVMLDVEGHTVLRLHDVIQVFGLGHEKGLGLSVWGLGLRAWG